MATTVPVPNLTKHVAGVVPDSVNINCGAKPPPAPRARDCEVPVIAELVTVGPGENGAMYDMH